MKKFVSMLLVLLTLLSCSITAFAAEVPVEQIPEVNVIESEASLVVNDDGSASPLGYAYKSTLTLTFKTITITNNSASAMVISSGLKSKTIASGSSGTLSFDTSKSRTVTLKCNNPISYSYYVT